MLRSALMAASVLAQSGLASGQTPAVEVEAVRGCVSDHEQSRLARINHRLFEARDAARRCSVSTCPVAIRADCSAWLAEIEQAVPTVLFLAESYAGEETQVRVFVDGQPVAEVLDGRPIELAPGPHRVRFQHADYPPIEQVLELSEGDKNRVVRIRFAGGRPPEPRNAEPAQTAIPAPAARAPTRARAQSASRPVPVPTYAFGLGSLAAAATAAILYGMAFGKRSSAEAECAPRCGKSITDPIRRNLLWGDIMAGSAAVFAGCAVYFYHAHPIRPEPGGFAAKAEVGASAFRLAVEGSY